MSAHSSSAAPSAVRARARRDPRLTIEFSPGASRFSTRARHALTNVLADAVCDGFPAGFSLSVVQRSGVVVRAWGGFATTIPSEEPVDTDTIYDLASLSKVVATTTLALWLVEQGRWKLSDPLSRWLSDLGRDDITLRDLLTHTSGIIAHRPFFQIGRRPRAIRRAVYEEARRARPTGSVLYSDLNFMLLGWAIERCSGEPLDALFATVVTEPLALRDTLYRPDARRRARCAATELDGDQRLAPGLVRGEVHDGNAWALGGVAGHAGLFSTASDLSTFVGELLDPRRHQVLSARSKRRLSTYQAGHQPDVRALGWRLEPRGWGTWPDATFWHTGFTGTSLLVSPGADLGVILLTNAVHPTRDLERQARMRAAIHRAIAPAAR